MFASSIAVHSYGSSACDRPPLSNANAWRLCDPRRCSAGAELRANKKPGSFSDPGLGVLDETHLESAATGTSFTRNGTGDAGGSIDELIGAIQVILHGRSSFLVFFATDRR
jgi:hypothetical protein